MKEPIMLQLIAPDPYYGETSKVNEGNSGQVTMGLAFFHPFWVFVPFHFRIFGSKIFD